MAGAFIDPAESFSRALNQGLGIFKSYRDEARQDARDKLQEEISRNSMKLANEEAERNRDRYNLERPILAEQGSPEAIEALRKTRDLNLRKGVADVTVAETEAQFAQPMAEAKLAGQTLDNNYRRVSTQKMLSDIRWDNILNRAKLGKLSENESAATGGLLLGGKVPKDIYIDPAAVVNFDKFARESRSALQALQTLTKTGDARILTDPTVQYHMGAALAPTAVAAAKSLNAKGGLQKYGLLKDSTAQFTGFKLNPDRKTVTLTLTAEDKFGRFRSVPVVKPIDDVFGGITQAGYVASMLASRPDYKEMVVLDGLSKNTKLYERLMTQYGAEYDATVNQQKAAGRGQSKLAQQNKRQYVIDKMYNFYANEEGSWGNLSPDKLRWGTRSSARDVVMAGAEHGLPPEQSLYLANRLAGVKQDAWKRANKKYGLGLPTTKDGRVDAKRTAMVSLIGRLDEKTQRSLMADLGL